MIFNFDELCKKHIQKAENQALMTNDKYDKVTNYIECATEWMHLFNSEEDARRCLLQAEKICSEAEKDHWKDLWDYCIEGWSNIFADKDGMKRCAENKSHSKMS